MPAFELAVSQGADAVEFDVQLSSDGTPVVIHDETLERTTDGAGNVEDHTLSQLRALDASAGHRDFAGVHIPTLAEVLELLAPTVLTINIELKNSEVAYPDLEEKVLTATRALRLEHRVILSTFNHYSLRKLQSMGVTSELAALYTDPLFRPWRYASQLGVAGIHPPAVCVFGKQFVRKAHNAGIAVRPWVVNGERALRRMLEYRVDAVFTDTPDVALALRAES